MCIAVARASCATTSLDPTAVTASLVSRGMRSAGPALVRDTGVWDPLEQRAYPSVPLQLSGLDLPQVAVSKLPPPLLAEIPCCRLLPALSPVPLHPLIQPLLTAHSVPPAHFLPCRCERMLDLAGPPVPAHVREHSRLLPLLLRGWLPFGGRRQAL